MIIWFFSIITGISWADCRIHNLNTSFRIQEDSEISLFDSGKSLSEFKIQDQGALGTCYANATSAVLKTALPGHPDISYLDSALKYSTDHDQRVGSLQSRYTSLVKEKSFVEGGHICNTVAALQKSGGACPRDLSILENKEDIDPAIRSNLVKGLGTYFDHYNRENRKPENVEEAKRNVAKLIDSYNFEKTQLLSRCEDEKQRELPLAGAMETFIADQFYLHLQEEELASECDTASLKGFQSFLGPKTKVYNPDKIKVEIPASLENEFLGTLKVNSELMTLLSNNLEQSRSQNDENEKKIKENLGKAVKAFFMKKLQKSPGMEPSCMNQIQNDGFSHTEDELGEQFLSDIRYQKKKLKRIGDCKQLISDTIILEDLKESEINQCMSPQHLEDVLKTFESLIEVGETIDQSLLDKLTNRPKGYATQIKDILVPGCSNEANLISLDNVSCNSMAMCDNNYTEAHLYHTTYSGRSGECHKLETAKSIARSRIMKGINEGRALGISICTAFFNDPSVKTDYCRSAPPGVPGHSYHALAISGIRCKEGKIEYELLNSWGENSGCPLLGDSSNKNSAIECSVDKDGNRDGKFWVKEDVLIENTTELSDVVNNYKK